MSPDSADDDPDPGRDDRDPTVRPDGGAVERTEPLAAPAWRVPLRPGLLLGMTAFLATYGVVYSLRAGRVAGALSGLPFTVLGSTPELHQVVGWLVYRAHLVPIEFEYSLSVAESAQGLLSAEAFVGATDQLAAALDPGLLLAVPLVTLFVGGFYTAIEVGAVTPRRGAVAGATVVVGYLLLVSAALVVLTWNLSLTVFDLQVTATAGPELVRGVFVAGVLYPLVGGALGGAAAAAVSD